MNQMKTQLRFLKILKKLKINRSFHVKYTMSFFGIGIRNYAG